MNPKVKGFVKCAGIKGTGAFISSIKNGRRKPRKLLKLFAKKRKLIYCIN